MTVIQTPAIDLLMTEYLTLFHNMEGKDHGEMGNQMVWQPTAYPLGHRASLRFNNRRPYLFSKTFSDVGLVDKSLPDRPFIDSFVVADPTHNKKGKFPRSSAKRFTIKHLRKRRIVVFNVEWMKPLNNVKKEDDTW
jgi:hypothetical protein